MGRFLNDLGNLSFWRVFFRRHRHTVADQSAFSKIPGEVRSLRMAAGSRSLPPKSSTTRGAALIKRLGHSTSLGRHELHLARRPTRSRCLTESPFKERCDSPAVRIV